MLYRKTYVFGDTALGWNDTADGLYNTKHGYFLYGYTHVARAVTYNDESRTFSNTACTSETLTNGQTTVQAVALSASDEYGELWP